MTEAPSPTLICMTPVKNEAWILDRFLQCASTWADHIIVADQQSTDGTREIAESYDTVTLIDNDTPAYDEAGRQQLLINAAREIPVDGTRILIALDADEFLTANWMSDPEWQTLLDAEPGTVLGFRWVNVGPNVGSGWLDGESKPFGYVDDGRPHIGRKIHSPRVPVQDDSPWMHLDAIHVLHYQYANWERMKSKQRWYQCWERLNHPDKRPITIYRQYNFMHADVQQQQPLREEWLRGYEEHGIDMRTIDADAHYHWDRDVVDMLREHGADTFGKIAIWDIDWTEKGRSMGLDVNGELSDPRTRFEQRVHSWLARTQPRMENLFIRGVQKLLQLRGW
jgi:hypothetical protein